MTLTRTQQRIALCAAIALQAALLCGMLVRANLPLWTGQEIRVPVDPVDPRSMFRGQYARLRYAALDISESVQPRAAQYSRGQTVYVRLQQGEDGLYRAAAASFEKPESGVFLRGRVQNRVRHNSERGEFYTVRYGIEAFFAPKEKALALERELRRGATAVLMVSRSGQAAIQSIIPNSTRDEAPTSP